MRSPNELETDVLRPLSHEQILPMKTPNEDAIGQIVELGCDLIDYDPKNRKEHNAEDLKSLKESIDAEGLLQPIVVRQHPDKPNRYMIIAGERRHRAHVMGKREMIQARIVKHDPNAVNAAGAARKRLVENMQREDLTPIEEARGYRELSVDFKMTHAEIAKLAGVSQPVVGNALRLLDCPGKVQDMIQTGLLSRAHGVALARFKAWPQVCLKIAELAVKDESSAKDLERNVPFAWELGKAGLIVEIGYKYTVPPTLKQDPDFIKDYSNTVCMNPAKWEPEKKRQDAAQVAKEAAEKKKETASIAKNGKPTKEQLARKKKIADNKTNCAAATQGLVTLKATLKATRKIEKAAILLLVEKVLQNGHYSSQFKDAAEALGITLPKGAVTYSYQTWCNTEKLGALSDVDLVRLAVAAIGLYHGQQAVKFAHGVPDEITALIGKKGGKAK